jgi:hypothetical protein
MSPKGKRFMNMPALATGFAQRVEKYEQGAADAATQMSREMSRRFTSNRPLAPARPGRPTTSGMFANFIQWQRTASGMIEFDLATLETAAPYWLILEIGTGESAQILSPSGTASVRSQRGRHIPWSLYWGDAPGSGPTGRMSGKKRLASGVGAQQLYLVSSLPKGAQRPGSPGIIRREIKGKHYIQDGGRTGFALMRDQILADARRTFR